VNVTVQTGQAIPFEQFWSWLKLHANCILRASSADCSLYDQESLHWQFEEDVEGHRAVLLLLGKTVIGELLLQTKEILFVQAVPDDDPEQSGRFVFELIGGPREEPYPLYHFLLQHGFEGEERVAHPVSLKH